MVYKFYCVSNKGSILCLCIKGNTLENAEEKFMQFWDEAGRRLNYALPENIYALTDRLLTYYEENKRDDIIIDIHAHSNTTSRVSMDLWDSMQVYLYWHEICRKDNVIMDILNSNSFVNTESTLMFNEAYCQAVVKSLAIRGVLKRHSADDFNKWNKYITEHIVDVVYREI